MGLVELDPPYDFRGWKLDIVVRRRAARCNRLMADFEGGEFAGGGADVVALVADVVREAVADGLEERVGFVAVAFGDELDAAVGEVADVAGDVVLQRDVLSGIAEPNPLHATRKMARAAMH